MADEIRDCDDLDAHLAPYVDGEETPGIRRSVDDHLAKCPPCRHHADAESRARDLVRRHRDQLAARAPESLRARCAAQAAAAPPVPGRPTSLRQPPASVFRFPLSVSRKWAAVAATLALAVAGVFMSGLNDRVEALAASLTVDHVKCFKVGDRDARADAASEQRHWQQEQGWPIVVPQTTASQQLQLVDVRRCFSTDGRAAHMMYRWRGRPLSLYVLPEDAGSDRVVQRMGHQAVIWCANRRTYAVVAEGQPQDLAQIVDYLKAHAQ